MPKRLSLWILAVLAFLPVSAEAFVCGRSLSSNDVGEQAEQQVGEPGSLECLVDNLLTEQMNALGLPPNDTISTEMVSASIGAVDGRPLISYTFHYTVWAEQFDLLAKMWADEHGKFDAAAREFSANFAGEVCDNGRDEAGYFAAGGQIRVLVKLSSSAGLKKFFYETLVDMEIKDCEAN
jgi:hypothetical protein